MREDIGGRFGDGCWGVISSNRDSADGVRYDGVMVEVREGHRAWRIQQMGVGAEGVRST